MQSATGTTGTTGARAKTGTTEALDEILALDRAHVIHPIFELSRDLSRDTKIFVGGKGVELELADGRRVIDGFSGLFNMGGKEAPAGEDAPAEAGDQPQSEDQFAGLFQGSGSMPRGSKRGGRRRGGAYSRIQGGAGRRRHQ